MASEILGILTCPHCGNVDATIHRHGKNNRLYYRCYVGRGSNQMQCGTAQIIGPTGQQYLQNKLDNQNAIAKPEPVPAPIDAIAKPEPVPAPKPAPAKDGVTSGFLDRFLAGDPDE